MSSTTETGHGKIVSIFENLYKHCLEYGPAYSPSYPGIQLTALSTKLGNARNAITAVQTAKTAYDDATNHREVLFSGVQKLATRIISALIASNAPKQRVDDARTVNRKLNGRRAKALPPVSETARETAPGTGTEEVPGRRSVSQRSFDALIDNLSQLIRILAAEPLYNPSETDLQVTALDNFTVQLRNSCSDVMTLNTQYENARIARDEELYHPETGIANLGRQAKTYVRSIFGTSSPQYQKISGLKFASR